MDNIKMVDLLGQYKHIKNEIDQSIRSVILSSSFIKGTEVSNFELTLAKYLKVKHVITCGNGTDALQIALMGLNLNHGDEVITTDFTFAATVEVIALLGLTPVLVDVDSKTMTIDVNKLERAITPKTKAIIPVHLFGQCADMTPIKHLAETHKLHIIEDTAQAIGSQYLYNNNNSKNAGTIGTVGTTSFFPSKNLGGYGDGGALFTNDDNLAQIYRSIANHGMSKRYHYERIGINSRLDTLQAGILNVKLKYLDQYTKSRCKVAGFYDQQLNTLKNITIPYRAPYSTHVFHQYTIQVNDQDRDKLQKHLKSNNIPSMVYYPIPLHSQEAYQMAKYNKDSLNVTENLCNTVLSLPIHTEMTDEQLNYIIKSIKQFFN